MRALPAVVPPTVTVRIGDPAMCASRAAPPLAEVARSRFRLRLRRGRQALVQERAAGLFYERGGTSIDLLAVESATPLPDGVQLRVATSEGLPATVTLRFLTRRTLEVALEPPGAAGVTAVGERLRSPRRERIYGLTERLRDSPPLAPGVVDQTIDDIRPPEVGSLDRRGETVEMRVLPTFSLYAPFYQSSRGYGLAVAGTTFGVFDLAQERSVDRRVPLRDRERLPAVPAARSTLFAGPDHAHDSRRVHQPGGPALRAAGLGVPALALARRAAPRARRRCSTASR